ncbi:MAG: hypothetical protein LBS25_09210 [Candidatus Symbiothrix sp.]|jgi:hypothetical protein|nr:hypothetical protein [Candidatus Symbiothrix sp.]
MNRERYELQSAQSLTLFEFISIGQKEKIPKVILFSDAKETKYNDFSGVPSGTQCG